MSSSEVAKELFHPAVEAEDTGLPTVEAVATVAVAVAVAVAPAPMPAPASVTLSTVDAWQVIPVRVRLDAETHPELMMQIHEVLAEGCSRLALDLSQNQFFSLAAIQLCMGLAKDLAGDGGALALIGCNERTKKHFDVYGSLKQITVVRTMSELVSDRKSSVVIRPRSSQALR